MASRDIKHQTTYVHQMTLCLGASEWLARQHLKRCLRVSPILLVEIACNTQLLEFSQNIRRTYMNIYDFVIFGILWTLAWNFHCATNYWKPMFGKEWNHSRVKSFKEWDRCLGCKQVYWVVLCTLSAINALKRALLHQEFVLHGSCWPGLAFVPFEWQWWALGCPELRKRHFIAFLRRSWLSLKSPPDTSIHVWN